MRRLSLAALLLTCAPARAAGDYRAYLRERFERIEPVELPAPDGAPELAALRDRVESVQMGRLRSDMGGSAFRGELAGLLKDLGLEAESTADHVALDRHAELVAKYDRQRMTESELRAALARRDAIAASLRDPRLPPESRSRAERSMRVVIARLGPLRGVGAQDAAPVDAGPPRAYAAEQAIARYVTAPVPGRTTVKVGYVPAHSQDTPELAALRERKSRDCAVRGFSDPECAKVADTVDRADARHALKNWAKNEARGCVEDPFHDCDTLEALAPTAASGVHSYEHFSAGRYLAGSVDGGFALAGGLCFFTGPLAAGCGNGVRALNASARRLLGLGAREVSDDAVRAAARKAALGTSERPAERAVFPDRELHTNRYASKDAEMSIPTLSFAELAKHRVSIRRGKPYADGKRLEPGDYLFVRDWENNLHVVPSSDRINHGLVAREKEIVYDWMAPPGAVPGRGRTKVSSGAGHLCVGADGRIIGINGNSGHFYTSLEQLEDVVAWLARRGAEIPASGVDRVLGGTAPVPGCRKR